MTVQPGFTHVQVDPFEGVDEVPGAAKNDPILVADGITRRFGGLMAVKVDHIEIQKEAITALIGPNGAGKTTLFNLLTGFDKPNSGTWSFEGEVLDGLGAHRTTRKGMVRTFQLTKSLSRLKVIDNMMLGGTGQTGERIFKSLIPGLWRSEERAIEERADALLERFKLAHMRDEFAGTLSGGQRKLLEMARALMVEPTLVMLDEPMAGVNPALAQSIIGHVQELRDEGLTVVFVEHDMDVVRTISEWVVVMGEGSIIAEGRHSSIVANPVVIDAYLGAHHETPLDRAEQDRQLAAAAAELERAELEQAEQDRKVAEAEAAAELDEHGATGERDGTTVPTAPADQREEDA
jgi:branched-chain amino acid transport system ATP-binding protein